MEILVVSNDNNTNIKIQNFSRVARTIPLLPLLQMATMTETMKKEVEIVNVVIIEWNDLMLLRDLHQNNNDIGGEAKSKIIQNAIDRSYGSKDGIGIMAIRGVPNFVNYKNSFLIQAHALATQWTEEYRETHFTDEASLYNAGWSYGKEQLGVNKPPDTSKGSFYYNPVTDLPGTEGDRQKYPYSYPCNVWPSDDDIPNFQHNAIQIGLLLKDVAIEVSKHLDVYVQNKLKFQPKNEVHTTITTVHHPMITTEVVVTSIHQHLKDTDKVKARLLYYYPLSSNSNNGADANDVERLEVSAPATEDSWIGWHNDSGFLTALAGDIYVNHKTGERIVAEHEIDPSAGLYIIDRDSGIDHHQNHTNTRCDNKALKVNIPYDCCAIQIGECVQIITGGILCATPHCVRGCRDTGSKEYQHIARISLPCFIDTHPSFPLVPPIGISRQQVLNADSYSHDKVPPLALRWKDTITTSTEPMSFGEFLHETFEMYYGWGSTSVASTSSV